MSFLVVVVVVMVMVMVDRVMSRPGRKGAQTRKHGRGVCVFDHQ